MSYLASLGSVLQHEGADHHLATPQSKLGASSGYDMPQTAISHPGQAVAVPPPTPAGDLRIADAVKAGMANQAAHPYQVDPSLAYQDVQFQTPQLGHYQPNYANLSYLMQRG